MASEDEVAGLRETFQALDTNGDGILSREEIYSGYLKTLGSEEAAQAQANAIMDSVDLDSNGYINYTEFLSAATNKSKLLSTQNLLAAFDKFDKDSSGAISCDELKAVIGIVAGENIWESLINEADTNGDGMVDFQEFQSMMAKLL